MRILYFYKACSQFRKSDQSFTSVKKKIHRTGIYFIPVLQLILSCPERGLTSSQRCSSLVWCCTMPASCDFARSWRYRVSTAFGRTHYILDRGQSPSANPIRSKTLRYHVKDQASGSKRIQLWHTPSQAQACMRHEWNRSPRAQPDHRRKCKCNQTKLKCNTSWRCSVLMQLGMVRKHIYPFRMSCECSQRQNPGSA